MKSILTVFLSLAILVAFSQERTGGPSKSINHGPATCPGFTMTPADGTTVTSADLVEAILGTDITSYSNVNFLGLQGIPNASAGLFTGGTNAGIGIESGIILSTGLINNAVGENAASNISGSLGLPGDAQLTALAGFSTFDATVLSFDFVPKFNDIFIQFVFGSDEYLEYVNTQYNDVFAFYLNGNNVALVPSTTTPITINTINHLVNTSYFKNNAALPGPFCNEMDGFTTVLVATGPVTANQSNSIKLAIADGSDSVYDSWVFIKTEGFSGVDPEVPISNWALFIGIGLILVFAVIRFRRLV